VTHRLNVRFRAPVQISKGAITLIARLKEHRRNIATIEVSLQDGDGNKCSEGEIDYYTLPRERAGEELHFPGKAAFYNS
jgi:acyl-coenzyme A thioesterase PaaI-like protein